MKNIPVILPEVSLITQKSNISLLVDNNVNGRLAKRYKKRFNSGKKRKNPDFIIAGKLKCGSTSLFYYLCQSPYFMPPDAKELWFFNPLLYYPNLDAYKIYFPAENKIKSKEAKFGKKIVTGEAAACYLENPIYIDRMHQLLPNIKLIVILRNPVDALISRYHHVIYEGAAGIYGSEPIVTNTAYYEPLGKNYEKWFEFDLKMKENLFKNPSIDYINTWYRLYSSSIYHIEISYLLERYPRENILFLSNEEMKMNFDALIKKVCSFLGIENFSLTDDKKYMEQVIKSDVTLDPDIRNKLLDLYRPHNEKLYDLIGQDFSWG